MNLSKNALKMSILKKIVSTRPGDCALFVAKTDFV